jgi:hypothetical protein
MHTKRRINFDFLNWKSLIQILLQNGKNNLSPCSDDKYRCILRYISLYKHLLLPHIDIVSILLLYVFHYRQMQKG